MSSLMLCSIGVAMRRLLFREPPFRLARAEGVSEMRAHSFPRRLATSTLSTGAALSITVSIKSIRAVSALWGMEPASSRTSSRRPRGASAGSGYVARSTAAARERLVALGGV